jgi:hypothetical protein
MEAHSPMLFIPFRSHGESRAKQIFLLLLSSLLILALLYDGRELLRGISNPLLDQFAFRQTQTALTTYWLAHGGPWFAYETPVLGAPWSIPYEFPLFEWIVAVLATAGVPLDAAGRIISFAFYIGTLGPLVILFRATNLGRIAFLSTAILFLTAPLYIYWSRAFLPESCALFFSCLTLALLALFLRERRWPVAVAATFAGSLATLAKATTFPAFAFVAGCLILLDLGMKLRARPLRLVFLDAIIPALIITLPLGIGYVWVFYSDQIKLINTFGTFLTSAHLARWNFGTMQQRLSATLWEKTIEDRVLPQLFGYAPLLAYVVVAAALIRARFAIGAVLAAVGFLVPFLVFTNLHVVHGYYQYANGLFALACVGIGLGSLAQGRQSYRYALAGIAILTLVVAQIGYFHRRFLPYVVHDYSQDRIYRIAKLANERTPPGSSILVFGEDWSSAVPYYAERKGLVVPFWTPPPLIDKVIADPQNYLGDRPLGGIVSCRNRLAPYGAHVTAIEKFVAEHAKIGEFDGCVLASSTVR